MDTLIFVKVAWSQHWLAQLRVIFRNLLKFHKGDFCLGSFAWSRSFGSSCELLLWIYRQGIWLDNWRSDPSLDNFHLGDFALKLSVNNFRFGSLIFRVGTFICLALDLWLLTVGFGSLAWELWLGVLGLGSGFGSLAWDLWLGIFVLGSLSWDLGLEELGF